MYVCVGERERERERALHIWGKRLHIWNLLLRFVVLHFCLSLFQHVPMACYVYLDIMLERFVPYVLMLLAVTYLSTCVSVFVHYHMFLFCGQFSPYALKSSSLRSLEH